MGLFRRSAEDRRRRALATASAGPLRDHLGHPLPDLATPLGRARLLALDLETTGLDPRTDRILSVGFVPVDGGRVVLGGAGRAVVLDTAGVGQSATVHGLTDDALAAGVPLEEAVTAVLHALTGRALLAHYARIETGFLDAACRRLWGAPLPCVVVDTFELERRRVADGWGREVPPGALRLWAARERHGLPVYRAHEALTDALACAELYLAQRAELEAAAPQTTPTLRQVMA
jgi:DNA polymerase-3 subunit epsilon